MTYLSITGLDEREVALLRSRARDHGWSVEDEARAILKRAIAEDDAARPHLVDVIRARMVAVRGMDLPPIKREPQRDPPDFSSL